MHFGITAVKFARCAIGLVLAVFLLGGSLRSKAEKLSADEYGVKAGFLYNLAKFVDWPPQKFPQADLPLIIGVAGPEPLERIRSVVRDKSIGSHKVVVKSIGNMEDALACHILFVSRSEKNRVIELVEFGRANAILTVGETEHFVDGGGMIRFYLESDSLRLEIDDDLIRNSKLTVKGSALSILIGKGIAKLHKG